MKDIVLSTLIQVEIANFKLHIMFKIKEGTEKDHFYHNFVMVDSKIHCVTKANRAPGYKLSFKISNLI
jgi:hypothetical protein